MAERLKTRLSQRAERTRGKAGDSGMSLVELVIVVMISALFLGLLAMLFGSGISTQQQATERDLATGQANVAAMRVNDAIRDSVGVVLYNTFTNHRGMPQTQLNLVKEVKAGDSILGKHPVDSGGNAIGPGGLVCEVWIWEDLPDDKTVLYYQYYGHYATSRVPGSVKVSEWQTSEAAGTHVRKSQGSGGGALPTTTHLSFEVGAREGDTTVLATGGGFAQGKINTAGKTNPCGAWA